MIRVRTIGTVEIWLGDRRLAKQTERTVALAVYLCARVREPLTRAHLAEMFWPESDESRGRHNLRQMLYRLRKMGFPLGEEDETVSVRESLLDCDIARVLHAGWIEAPDAELLESTATFLPGLETSISPAFTYWLEEIQARLTAQFRHAGLEQLKAARREGRWSALDRWSRVVLRHDPLNEEATLARAESAAMSGSKALALEILDNFVEDLGDKSSHIGLPAQILRRRIAESPTEWGGRSSRELPLVGRERELSTITRALSHARQGSGSAILLLGPAGIGKTRLVREVVRFARLNGLSCTHTQASAADQGRPLALGARLAEGLLDTPGVASCPPSAFGLLKRLHSPGAMLSPLDSLVNPAPQESTSYWAFAEAISAAAHERPLLVIVEDLHHADVASVSLLNALTEKCQSTRCLFVATARTVREMPTPGDPSEFVSVRLGALSASESVELLNGIDAAGTSLEERDRAAIVRTAGGNPFFLRELSFHRAAPHSAEELPESLQSLISHRLARFSHEELRVLRVTAALGPLATVARVRALLCTGSAQLPELVGRLEDEGLFAGSSPGRLTLHEIWQQGAMATLGGAMQATLALECAELLVAGEETEDYIDALWRAAELFSVAGERARARRTYSDVGAHLLRRGTPQSSVAAYQRAVALASDRSDVLALSGFLASAQHACGAHGDAIDTCRSALATSDSATRGRASARALLLAILADSETKCGLDPRESIASLAVAVADPDADDETRQQAALYGLRLVFTNADSPLVMQFLSASRAAANRSTLTPFGALVEMIVSSECGTSTESNLAENRLRGLRTEHLNPSVQGIILRCRAVCLRWLGRTEEAMTLFEQALRLAESSGLQRDVLLAAGLMAFAALDAGDLQSAERWIHFLEVRTPEDAGHDLRRTVLHSRGRLMLQRDEYAACLEHYRPHLEMIRRDGLRRRRAMDFSTVAVAAAHAREDDLASELLADVEAILESDRPIPLLDFAAECLLLIDRRTRREEPLATVVRGYLRRRADSCDRPIAPAFALLRDAGINSAYATMTRSASTGDA